MTDYYTVLFYGATAPTNTCRKAKVTQKEAKGFFTPNSDRKTLNENLGPSLLMSKETGNHSKFTPNSETRSLHNRQWCLML